MRQQDKVEFCQPRASSLWMRVAWSANGKRSSGAARLAACTSAATLVLSLQTRGQVQLHINIEIINCTSEMTAPKQNVSSFESNLPRTAASSVQARLRERRLTQSVPLCHGLGHKVASSNSATISVSP